MYLTARDGAKTERHSENGGETDKMNLKRTLAAESAEREQIGRERS